MNVVSGNTLTSPSSAPMVEIAPNAALLASLGRLVRGLSALFWALPMALVLGVQTAKGEWLKPLGFAPAVVAMGLILYGTWLLGSFQTQERIWMQALERARLAAIVNVGLSPFLFFWGKVSGHVFFSLMVQVLVITSLLYLYLLNSVLARLAAMLPDETLRAETKVFTRLNQTMLLVILPALPLYLVLRSISPLPRFIVEILLFLEQRSMMLEFAVLLCFILLPLAMTMALLWKTKEVILAGVFSSAEGERAVR